MRTQKFLNRIRALLVLLVFCLTAATAFASVPVGPSVNVMPDGDSVETSYTWAGNAITIWGNVKWGDAASGTYIWDFYNDGTSLVTGTVDSDAPANDLATIFAYPAGGHYEAKLTVTDDNGLSDSAIVRIYVKSSQDKDAQVNLAAGRRRQYFRRYRVLGGGSGNRCGDPRL